MKIKFLADENIPLLVTDELKKVGLEIESIFIIKRGMKDIEILKLAYENDQVIITFDKDFGQLVFKDEERTKGVILLRFIPSSPAKITTILKEVLNKPDFNPYKKFTVIHEKHIRMVDLP